MGKNNNKRSNIEQGLAISPKRLSQRERNQQKRLANDRGDTQLKNEQPTAADIAAKKVELRKIATLFE
ncbi:hypothetical protein [Rickettsiales endosymbiont of Stachyamoeba lipophora]|uniref:hypothetical protein n=1 Tax=Rickettsiales endosymbiont of Stachyamoeba lipophora TaxID=2486578 RepID=UPI000F64B034|nr:hypothetical protein [Rickettsiales endosymbiont of Stachyamoeba lipophora]AZL15196.1 hypothetical protein EF513_01300 [Rickettsiales endosymbiont of Stachyamoeba lipophora]